MFCTVVPTSRPRSVTSSTSEGVKESTSRRESESIPIACAPTRSGAPRRLRSPSSTSAATSPFASSSRFLCTTALPWSTSAVIESSSGQSEPAGNAASEPIPPVTMTRARCPSASTIATRSKATSPLSSRMKPANACSISREALSARAQRFTASSRSARRPSSSRSDSASLARASARAVSSRRFFTSQPTIRPESTSMPNWKVRYSALKA